LRRLRDFSDGAARQGNKAAKLKFDCLLPVVIEFPTVPEKFPARAPPPRSSPVGLGTKMNRRAVRQLILPALLLALCSAACRPTAPGVTGDEAARERVAGKRGGELSVRLTALPKTLNPLMAADEPSLLVGLYLISGRLVDFDHDAQRYAPGLAEEWAGDAEGRTVEVTLRDGLKFSDGRPLTAHDVVFTFAAVYDARTAAPLLRDALLVGGRPIEATAVDERRVRLTFPEKVAAAESYLINLPVLPRHALGEAFDQGRLGGAWGVTTDPSSVVTSGPFAVAALHAGERLRLKRNPHFWKRDQSGTPLPYLDGLTLEAVADANNTLLRLTQGALDIADRIRPSDFAALESSPGPARAHDLGPGLSTDHLWFNLNQAERDGQPVVSPVKRAWFADARFRRAVSHAIDREAIARTALRGLATPLYHFVSPGNRAWAAADLPRTEHDPARALALLGEAGFSGGRGGQPLRDREGRAVEFTLLVQAENEPRKLMAAVIQQDLERLGMRVQVAPLETQAVAERVAKTFDYEAVLMGLTLTDPEPSSYAGFLLSGSATHQWAPRQPQPATQWEARLDRLVAAQAREGGVEQRRALFREIQQVMAEQLPVIPVAARHIVSAAHARVGNYRPSSIFPYSLWNAEELFLR
jgi:peptide/nickel transport system substrate-binding protein